jgi:hypothetical protein
VTGGSKLKSGLMFLHIPLTPFALWMAEASLLYR